MRVFYGIMAFIGLVLPYMQFIGWLEINGLNLPLLIGEIVGSRLSLFAWLDVIISAIVLMGFILYEGKKQKMKKTYIYLPIVGTLSVGVSFGLPLFLLFKELHRESEDGYR